MYYTGRNIAPKLGDPLPWMFDSKPGSGSLWAPASKENSQEFAPRSIFGYTKSRKKPGTGRSRGGLGNADEMLGLSFNIPSLTTSYTPPASSGPTSLSPVTPASGTSTFWNPLESIFKLWDQRPAELKKIRIRLNPTKVAQAAATVLPPDKVGKAIDYARRLGFDPTYLTKFGEVPITGDMARYGFQAQTIEWGKYLPWIIGAGAAVVLVPMLLKK
jgi:hypothetical protein